MLPIIYVDVKEAHRVGGLRILHILATVVGHLVELVAHKVGHCLHLKETMLLMLFTVLMIILVMMILMTNL